jgi:hypothetical protein
MHLPFELIFFYGLAFAILIFLFSRKMKLLPSIMISLLIVLVASEFWEIPIFISGFIGFRYRFPYPSLAFLLHHVYTAILFILLIYVAKIKLRVSGPFWLLGLTISTLLIFYLLIPSMRVIVFWQARIIGTFFFGLGVYFGSSVLGFES